MVALNGFCGCAVALRRGFPGAPIADAVAVLRGVNVRRVLELGMQVEDVLPIARAQRANGVDVHAAIAAMSRKNPVAMLLSLAVQDAREGSAVDFGGRLSAGNF